MSFWNWLKSLFKSKGVLPDDPNPHPDDGHLTPITEPAPPPINIPAPKPSPIPTPSPLPFPEHKKWSHIDPKHIVPTEPLQMLLDYYDANDERIKQDGYAAIIDFSKHSGRLRFYIIGLDSGRVWTHAVAHGAGSDPNKTGFATLFSNVSGSHKTSLGMYLTGTTYEGSHGRSRLLHGMSKGLNDQVLARAIVIHGSAYVTDGAEQQGRSFGCFAVQDERKDEIIDQLDEGTLILAWHPQLRAHL